MTLLLMCCLDGIRRRLGCWKTLALRPRHGVCSLVINKTLQARRYILEERMIHARRGRWPFILVVFEHFLQEIDGVIRNITLKVLTKGLGLYHWKAYSFLSCDLQAFGPLGSGRCAQNCYNSGELIALGGPRKYGSPQKELGHYAAKGEYINFFRVLLKP